MLAKPSRTIFRRAEPGIPGWPGGDVCVQVPATTVCGNVVLCYDVPLPPGSIPPTGQVCVSQQTCYVQSPATVQCNYVAPYPAVPEKPDRYEEVGNNSWNSGANSALALSGDCEVAFSIPRGVVGVAVGFVADRQFPTDPGRIIYGMQFGVGSDGDSRFRVVENGQNRTQPSTYSETDTFKVRRVGQSVSYFKNGDRLYFSMRACTEGELIVGSSLYSFGDRIP